MLTPIKNEWPIFYSSEFVVAIKFADYSLIKAVKFTLNVLHWRFSTGRNIKSGVKEFKILIWQVFLPAGWMRNSTNGPEELPHSSKASLFGSFPRMVRYSITLKIMNVIAEKLLW